MKCFMSGNECEYVSTENPFNVFVVSPFGYPFDDVFKSGIEPLLRNIEYGEINSDCPAYQKKSSFSADRADQSLQLGFVMCQRICRRIQESKYILADITKPNPNVFYELGLSYGLKKQIVLIGQQTLSEANTFGLTKMSESYVHYRSMNDFDKIDMFKNAFKNAIRNESILPDLPNSKILNIINEKATIKGLHENTLTNSISELQINKNLKIKNWSVKTIAISNSSTINDILSDFIDCKICVIDASIYGKRLEDVNPLMFFLLGLGHGFEKEVIPLTNTPYASNILPFDVRGLWHIFFNNLKQLKSQFMGIMPEIDKNWYNQQQDYLYRKFWDSILENRDLHIMTCARDTDKAHRGRRTDIDKWDYTAVSEISRFLALKYPNSQVNISPPTSKLSNDKITELGEDEVKSIIKDILYDKDCIIIGSPDVSDLAEIVLAELHKIKPYQNARLSFKGYVMIKTQQPNRASSFYWEKNENETEGIYLYEEESGDYTRYENIINDEGGKIYGILVMADNPFVSKGVKRKLMILSGFSGISTYAIAKLLTDEKYKEELIKLDENTLKNDTNYEVLIGCKYNFDTNKKSGDNRMLTPDSKNIFFKDINKIYSHYNAFRGGLR